MVPQSPGLPLMTYRNGTLPIKATGSSSLDRTNQPRGILLFHAGLALHQWSKKDCQLLSYPPKTRDKNRAVSPKSLFCSSRAVRVRFMSGFKKITRVGYPSRKVCRNAGSTTFLPPDRDSNHQGPQIRSWISRSIATTDHACSSIFTLECLEVSHPLRAESSTALWPDTPSGPQQTRRPATNLRTHS